VAVSSWIGKRGRNEMNQISRIISVRIPRWIATGFLFWGVWISASKPVFACITALFLCTEMDSILLYRMISILAEKEKDNSEG
jgi:hypothetical protein